MKKIALSLAILSLSAPCLAMGTEAAKELCNSKSEIAQYVMTHRQIGTPKEELLAKIREKSDFAGHKLAALDQVVELIYEMPIHEEPFDRLKATQEIKIGVFNSCIEKIAAQQ